MHNDPVKPPPPDEPPPDFSALSQCLNQPPSVDNWLHLCRTLASWPASQFGRLPLLKIQETLTSWPHALCHLYSDPRRLSSGAQQVLWQLCRTMTLSHRSDGDAQLHRIATSPYLTQLMMLTLDRSNLSTSSLLALGYSKNLPALHTLKMSGLDLTPAENEAFAQTPLGRKVVLI